MSDDDKLTLDELIELVDEEVDGNAGKPEPRATDGGSDKPPATPQDDSDKLADAFARGMQLTVGVSEQDKPDRTVFANKMSPLLSVLGSSTVAATAFAEQVKSGVANKTVKPIIAVFVLNGLAARSTAEARAMFSAKQIDFAKLSGLSRQFLAAEIEWQAVVPQAKAVAAPAPAPTPPMPTPTPAPEPPKAEPVKTDEKPKAALYDWKAGEAEFDRSDPAWRPKVESTGDELLDSIAANQALVDEWLSESP